MSTLLTARQRRALIAATLLVLLGGWQLLSMLVTTEVAPGEPMVPGWQALFTRTFLSLAAYWNGGFGVPTVAEGARPTYQMAFLSVASHSLATLSRLVVGVILGVVVGALLGLAVSWSRWARRLTSLPANLLRGLPLLAMIPLFQLWFGISFWGQVTFIAWGIFVIIFTAVINAVGNIPPIFTDNARTFGASKLRIYSSVVLPAITPEMRSAFMLSLGAGWSGALGAEYLGAQSGLGYVVVLAETFAYLDRMFFIALLIVIYSGLSVGLTQVAFTRLTRWSHAR